MNNIALDPPGFVWSYSHLKNYETCPKRYYHYQVAKDVREPESAQLAEGNQLHAAFDARLGKGTPLPLGYGQYEKMLANILNAPGQTYSEQKLALTSTFQPTAFFNKAAWFRTVIDVAKVSATTAVIFDWKTGAVKEDKTQLDLMAATVFAQQPSIERVRAALVFVAHDQVIREEYVREDLTEIWGEVLPRVRKLVEARRMQEYPPTPSRLCKRYCAVLSCPYHGKGR